MSDVHHPYDRLVKELISHPESVQSLVRDYLPVEIVNQLDLSTLTPAKNNWVDSKLQEHFADLLFKCGWAKKPDRPKPKFQLFVLVLIEHKSQPDRFVRLQLLQYQQQCWSEHLNSGKFPLPIVIPIVLYHGKAPWRDSRQFADQFGQIPDAFQRFVPRFEFELLDVSPQSETKIVGDPLARVALNLLRWVHDLDTDDVKSELPNLLAQLPPDQATQLRYMQPIFQFLLSTRMLNTEEMGAALQQAFPEPGNLMKTFIDELLEKGRGEGREEGIRTGQMAATLRLLRRKFGDKTITKTLAGRIEKLALPELEQLCDQLLEFKAPVDLQRWLAGRK